MQYRKWEKFIKFTKQYTSSVLISLGCGSVISILLNFYMRNKIIPILPHSENEFQKNLTINKISDIMPIEFILFSIGIIMILFGVLSKTKGKEYITLLLFIFTGISMLELLGFISVIRSGEITMLFLFSQVLLISLVIWIFKDVSIAVYEWLKDDEGKLDVPKLALIWTMITFIINLIWIGR